MIPNLCIFNLAPVVVEPSTIFFSVNKSCKTYPWPMLPSGVNFINMCTCGFFAGKTKNLLVFENEFHHAFSYENCAGCAIRKLHLAVLAVLVAIHKLQLGCITH